MNKIIKIFRILPVFPALFCFSCNKTEKTDTEQYVDILNDCISDRDFHSQLYIFPKSIEGLQITKFLFSHTESLYTGDWLMYLGLKWDEQGFNSELERLNNVKAVYKTGEVKPVIKFEDKSLYLTISKDNRYEYAIYNRETYEIVYVSNQLYEWDEIPVKPEHILSNVRIPEELDDGSNTYNIYYLFGGDVGVEVVD